jgi:hypothetical protein
MTSDDFPRRIVALAVERAWEQWALEHPSLAAALDDVQLINQAAESVRRTPAYRRAVETFYRDEQTLMLFERLWSLAGPALRELLNAAG